MIRALIDTLPPDLPVLVVGPTASGKSALALAIAEAQGGNIINADASQVFDCWRILTARPSRQEEARAPHALYGHIPYDSAYSVGRWLREVKPLLDEHRPIIVGGTGLYFTALTEGLSDIPATPANIRAEADALALKSLIAGIDPQTASRIDLSNRMRVQRAWEVQQTTGTGLAAWHNVKSQPLLPAGTYSGVVLDSPKDWLTPRIAHRFDQMLRCGALDEARAMQDRYDPALPSCRAIGVAETMALISGETSREVAIETATIATRQYAKRQRTWFRSRMAGWQKVASASLGDS